MSLGGLLLAAGASRRFGAADKLLADLHGEPLVAHAAGALRRAGPDHLVATVASAAVSDVLAQAGFLTVMIAPGQPQSASLAAGMEKVQDLPVSRCLLALGDMPYLAAEDFASLLAKPADMPACMWLGKSPGPPAVFPGSWFDRLRGVTGDRGARELLQDIPKAQHVVAPPDRLRDIDRVADLPSDESSARLTGGRGIAAQRNGPELE